MYLRMVVIKRKRKKLRERERNGWRREKDKTKHAFMWNKWKGKKEKKFRNPFSSLQSEETQNQTMQFSNDKTKYTARTKSVKSLAPHEHALCSLL